MAGKAAAGGDPDRCEELGIASAVVYRGTEGYGSSTRIHRASPWKFSRDAPIMMSILDTEAQIARSFRTWKRWWVKV